MWLAALGCALAPAGTGEDTASGPDASVTPGSTQECTPPGPRERAALDRRIEMLSTLLAATAVDDPERPDVESRLAEARERRCDEGAAMPEGRAPTSGARCPAGSPAETRDGCFAGTAHCCERAGIVHEYDCIEARRGGTAASRSACSEVERIYAQGCRLGSARVCELEAQWKARVSNER